MRVTKVQSLSKMKMRVFLDGKPAFAASPAIISQWKLYEGKELDEEQESILMRQISMFAARTATELLAQKEYSAHDLEQKLRQKEFLPEAVRFAMDYVRQKRFQDDVRYAEAYIRSHSSKKSRMQMRMYLLSHGVSEDVITQSLQENETDDIDLILSELEKRFGPDGEIPDSADPAYSRMLQSLQRKGFRYTDIRSAISVFSNKE